MFEATLRYGRHRLAALATVAFGDHLNEPPARAAGLAS